MVPTLIMFHPSIARSLLDYRFFRVGAARAKRETYNNSWQGIMYPWESAFTGREVCPWKAGALYEQHITADVSFACMRYFYASGDIAWMRERGSAIVNGSAEFWASRVVRSRDGSHYEILNVIPPDESAGVRNNSCYTNAAAAVALRDGRWLGTALGYPTPASWDSIANGIVIPFNSTMQIHPEYDGYDGALINQPDVVLLQYPLRWKPYPAKIQLNDLSYYTKHTNMASFFTGYSTNGILYLEHDLPDEAQHVFDRAWKFMQKPFSVWREKLSGGHQNFLTGAGGFLQQAVFGYSGLRIERGALQLSPKYLPKGVAALTFRRMSYLGVRFDLRLELDRASIVLVQDQKSNKASTETTLTVTQGDRTVPVSNTPAELKLAPFSVQRSANVL
jgi:protein-glucosylgalactosylhydroxylysine glucosidase